MLETPPLQSPMFDIWDASGHTLRLALIKPLRGQAGLCDPPSRDDLPVRPTIEWREITNRDWDALRTSLEGESWIEELLDIEEHLLNGWGRAGDEGIMGLRDEEIVAAAWYRSFADAPAHLGFIDPGTPVLANAWVKRDLRRQGLGTEMLTQLLDCCRASGNRALSLATDQDNEALRLYRRLGFEVQTAVASRWVLVRAFD